MSRLRLIDREARTFVLQVCAALAEEPNADSGLSRLLAEVNEYLGTEAISVFLLDQATHELVLTYAASPDREDILGLRIAEGQGVGGWVVKHNEDLIVPSTNLDPRFFSGVDERTGFVTRSILCVPIVQAGQAVGAIEALNKTTGHFNADDVILLQEISGAVADCLTTH